MRNLAALLILSASRHILRIRRRRADWRRAFCVQLRAVVDFIWFRQRVMLALVSGLFGAVVGACVTAWRFA